MNYLADHIEAYIDELESTMIIPNDIAAEHEDQIKEALKRCRTLIKKLRKGDTSVFKDQDAKLLRCYLIQLCHRNLIRDNVDC